MKIDCVANERKEESAKHRSVMRIYKGSLINDFFVFVFISIGHLFH